MGEVEQRERFAYGLSRAMERRKMSARKLAGLIGVDPRRIAALQQGKALPTIYESPRLADALRVDESLFRNPPEVPKPPPYPLDRYLIDDAAYLEARRRADAAVLGSPGDEVPPERSARRAKAG